MPTADCPKKEDLAERHRLRWYGDYLARQAHGWASIYTEDDDEAQASVPSPGYGENHGGRGCTTVAAVDC